MGNSRGFDVSFWSTDGDWESNQSPDAQPGGLWLAGVQSVGRWLRCDFSMERDRSPDAQIRLFGLDVDDCSLLHLFSPYPFLQCPGAHSDD